MHMVQSIVVLVASMAMGISCQPLTQLDSEGDAQLKTNIAVLSPNESLKDLMGNVKEGLTVIDPEKMLDNASVKLANPDDIVEDPTDPFITSASGKLRPDLVHSGEDWAEPTIGGRIDSNLLRRFAKPLTRVKRCGDGGGGGNDANRPRAGFRRSKSMSGRNNNLTRTTTTTTTRTVLKDGKVVSQTVIPQSGVVQHQPVVNQVVAQQQPVVVHQHQPAQQVVAAAHPHVVAAGQPQVVSAPPQVVAAHPQVVAAQPQLVAAQPQVVAAQPQVAAPAPSISVQGSVKVN